MEHFLVGRLIIGIGGQLGFELTLVFVVAQLVSQIASRRHRGPIAVYRVEPGEREPCFVPEEHQIRLDGQAFLHDALDVVDDAVEGAVGQ